MFLCQKILWKNESFLTSCHHQIKCKQTAAADQDKSGENKIHTHLAIRASFERQHDSIWSDRLNVKHTTKSSAIVH